MLSNRDTKVSAYFNAFGNRVMLNRCPHCNVGMVVDAPTVRACPKCGYSDNDPNTPFKFNLRFEIVQTPNVKEVSVLALEPTGKESYRKVFQDYFTAERYVERLRGCCLDAVNAERKINTEPMSI